MPELVNAKEIPVTFPGSYNINMIIPAGNIKLQYSVMNQAFVDIPDSTYTADTGFTLSLPECKLKAIISDASAHAFLTPVGS